MPELGFALCMRSSNSWIPISQSQRVSWRSGTTDSLVSGFCRSKKKPAPHPLLPPFSCLHPHHHECRVHRCEAPRKCRSTVRCKHFQTDGRSYMQTDPPSPLREMVAWFVNNDEGSRTDCYWSSPVHPIAGLRTPGQRERCDVDGHQHRAELRSRVGWGTEAPRP